MEGTSSWHKVCTQCSVRVVSTKCGCDFVDLEKRVNKSVLQTFLRTIRGCQVRGCDSTADVGYWASQKKCSSEVMQATATFAFTQRQTETAWEAVKPCFKGNAPDFEAYEKAVKGLVQSKQITCNANFRTLNFKKYWLDRNSSFKSCERAPFWRIERLALECAHHAAISVSPSLRAFHQEPTSKSFAALYEEVYEEFGGRMQGVFGEYGAKRYWDCYIAGTDVDRNCVSRWPGDCPGYTQGLRRLFTHVTASEQERMLFWLHNQRTDARGLCVGETAAQLCFWASPRCSKNLRTSVGSV